MRRKRYLLFPLFFFLFCLPFCAEAQVGEKKLTVEFKNEELSSVFKQLSKISGYKILFTYDDVKSYTYSGAIKDKNIREILDIVLSGKKLEYTIDKEFITITTKGPSKQAKVYTVNGVVLSADDGEPLIGATVMVKGTSTGVLTDIDGKFTLPNVSSRSKLEFSYVGMLPQSLSPSPTMKVTLQSDVQTLSEVVVTGMQRMDKRMFTGATDQLKAENIKMDGMADISRGLEGRSAGVSVQNVSGTFGTAPKIRVRGATSIYGSSKPLWVVDGVIMEDVAEIGADDLSSGDAETLISSAIAGLNADDIESFQILKDGSATSIYGARAMAGVIVVTTKKGKGKTTVDYGFNMRFTTNGIMAFSPSMQEYASMWLEANKEMPEHDWWGWGEENLKKMAQGIEGIYESTVADWGTMFVGNANRLDELFARRYSYQHNLSVAGSTDKSDYRISLAYADNQANLATAYDGQKQLNLRLNYGIKLTDWFKLETSASMIKTNTETPTHGIDRTLYGNDAPFFPAKNPYGQWYANFGNVGDRNAAAATTDGGRDEREKLTTRVDFKALVDIWKGITFEGTASFQNEEYRRERYSLPVQCYNWFGEQTAKLVYETTQTLSTPQDVLNFKDSHQPGYLVQANNARYQYYSGLLKYKRTFAEVHNIDAMFGINAEKWVTKKVVTAREKFEDAGIYDLNLATGTQGNGGGKTHNGTYSYIARLNYNYAEKYMVELMGRRDGNSKFAPGYRFKSFGSVSLGWAFSEEQFVEFLKPVLSFGKLRLSYGSSGNDVGLGDYDYVSTVSLGTAGFGTIPANQVSSGFGGLISYDRTWEKVSQKNFGIDLNFFDNRLKATFDYFIKDNTGMLVNVTYPGVLGGKAPKTNSGHLNVKGWEFTIGWRDQIKDFSYYANFNIGDTKSLLKEMEGADSYGAGWNAAVNGYPLNSYFLYRTDGYFKDQAEVDRYYALYGEGKEDLTGVGAGSASRLRPGDTKRLDLNGDYKISGAGNENSDLQYLGDSNPHFVFGFTLGGSWKGIDVNAMFQGVGKQYVIRNDWMAYPFQTRTANQNPTYLGKTWTESNPNAEFPRLTTNANLARWNYQNNDFMMQNNRYIRLKTLIVGYTLPQIWTRKVKLEKVRVYFSGNDLWEATSIRDGFDPEMGAASNNSGYPFARTWSFGLNITL